MTGRRPRSSYPPVPVSARHLGSGPYSAGFALTPLPQCLYPSPHYAAVGMVGREKETRTERERDREREGGRESTGSQTVPPSRPPDAEDGWETPQPNTERPFRSQPLGKQDPGQRTGLCEREGQNTEDEKGKGGDRKANRNHLSTQRRMVRPPALCCLSSPTHSRKAYPLSWRPNPTGALSPSLALMRVRTPSHPPAHARARTQDKTDQPGVYKTVALLEQKCQTQFQTLVCVKAGYRLIFGKWIEWE